MKLPAPTQVKIYSIDKILKSRGKLSTIEKINHLLDLQIALKGKLKQKVEIKKQANAMKQDKIAKGNFNENPESSLDEEVKSEPKASDQNRKETNAPVAGAKTGTPRSSKGLFKTQIIPRNSAEFK